MTDRSPPVTMGMLVMTSSLINFRNKQMNKIISYPFLCRLCRAFWHLGLHQNPEGFSLWPGEEIIQKGTMQTFFN